VRHKDASRSFHCCQERKRLGLGQNVNNSVALVITFRVAMTDSTVCRMEERSSLEE
jgi:hypothetical protein